MKFKIITLGCKVNAYESEYIREKLIKNNFICSDANPDIIIINTCSVTNTADNKSLKIVRHMKRTYPNSIFVVCGCSTENNKAKYADLGIDILLGNRNKNKIVDILNEYLKEKKSYVFTESNNPDEFEDMQINKFTTHTRAFIKIQDGCNNFCSYCIIPYVRGNIRSKDFDKVIEEANALVKNHHQEIVLTGIHTGTYNSKNHDLSDLILELAKIPDLKRIRISSIEITELDDKFLNVLKTCPKVVDHLHIPLQSGSAEILKRMNRKYDKEYFKNKVMEIRKIRPDIALTTDVIVGHPYETEELFQECVSFVKEINFAKIHVFPYSLRAGTASSKMPQVDPVVRKERARRLLKVSEDLEKEYISKYLNKEVEVLTEEYANKYMIGHTPNYIKVCIEGDALLNSFYNVLITRMEDNVLYGRVVTCHNEKVNI